MGTVSYLLDTHTFLWAIQKDVKLSEPVKKAMNDKNAQKFISAVSAYEIMYKYQIGKLPEYEDIAVNYFDVLQRLGAYELSLNAHHAYHAGKFEWTHRDPFDRLLAAQAYLENLALITNDPAFEALPWVSTLW